MALFSECKPECAQKDLTGVGIVREAIYQQLRLLRSLPVYFIPAPMRSSHGES